MSHSLKHPKGNVLITDLSDNKKQIRIDSSAGVFVPIKSCETNYPLSLIQLILEVKGADYLCDEICRDIDPHYVQADLEYDLTAYFSPGELNNIRILDFGCGSGASSMILSRMFPDSEIVGVELDENYLQIARKRLEHYGYSNVVFFSSPSGNELPPNVGEFDLVIMSAVYEHLLPNERKTVMPLVWSVIKPGGHLFLNMTPHRWFPIEHHTTGLPLLNYLPKSLALPFARAFSNRIDNTEPWEMLLRRGIRGATEGEILNILETPEHQADLVEPNRDNIRDRIDLWFSQLNKERHSSLKGLLRGILKTIRDLTGVILVPNLSLVIRKSASPVRRPTILQR